MTIVLHKPARFRLNSKRSHARDTIFDLLPPKFPRLFNVGRLDAQSEGLLLLTNNGDLAQQLTHPRHEDRKGIRSHLGPTMGQRVGAETSARQSCSMGNARGFRGCIRSGRRDVRVVLRPGINQQIRRMFYTIGYEVKQLVRVRIGHLRLGDLPRGQWRPLTKSELANLNEARRSKHTGRAREQVDPVREQNPITISARKKVFSAELNWISRNRARG